MWPKPKVENGKAVGFEMPELHGDDRWLALPGRAMSNDVTEQKQMSPAEARRLIERDPKAFCAYVEIGNRDDSVLLCRPGGGMLGRKNGVPADYTCYIYRTHGLPPARFTDTKFVDGLRPGRGERAAESNPELSRKSC